MGVLLLDNEQLDDKKIKLWAITGIMLTFQHSGMDSGVDLKKQQAILHKSLSLYKDTDLVEQILDAQRLIDSLYNEIVGSEED